MTVQLEPHMRDDLVRVASSQAQDTELAMQEVLAAVGAASASFSFVFYSPAHDAEVVASQLEPFGVRAIAGSTAGEIGPGGFMHGGISAVALHGPHSRAAVRILPHLADFSLLRASGLAAELARDLGHTVDQLDPNRHIWVLLLDGLSGREDFFTPFFATHAPRLPLVGGSFGDDFQFGRVTLAHDGRVHASAGAVLLLEYDRPFEVIHHTHLEFTENWYEVTDTENGGRLLTGLDGQPAVEVYASGLGVSPEELAPEVTSLHPFGYRFKGRPFPCSIMRSQGIGLHLAYSVQRGDRLNVLRPVALVEKSKSAIAAPIESLRARGAAPHAMLAFHCLGRYHEAEHLGVVSELFDAMNQLPIAGLNTYGEQFGSRHMNHSLCGILFG